MPSGSSLSPQKLATYNRQKCINLLEKITKNLFRMFRDEQTTKEQLTERFFHLHQQLEILGDIVLNTEYHREMKLYIEKIAHTLSGSFDLESIRSPNMTQLNRLQKIKNTNNYKRTKKDKRDKHDKHGLI